MIVLDTNQFKQLKVPRGGLFAILHHVSRQHHHTIAIPEMVLAEVLAHYRHDVELDVEAIESGCRGLLRRGVQIKPKLPDVDLMVQLQREEICTYVTVLRPADDAAWGALQREAHRRRPADTSWEKKGGGARDALIWLTVMHAARQPGSEPVLLVTADADFGRDGQLHLDLREELRDAGISSDHVQLCPSVTEALNRLADKTEPPADLEQVLKSEQAVRAVNTALAGRAQLQLHWLYREQLAGADAMRMEIPLAADDFQPTPDGTTEAYQIGAETWVSAQRTWQGTYWVTLNRVNSRYGQPAFDMPFEVDVSILIGPEDSATERIQVMDCGMPRFSRDWLIPTERRKG